MCHAHPHQNPHQQPPPQNALAENQNANRSALVVSCAPCHFKDDSILLVSPVPFLHSVTSVYSVVPLSPCLHSCELILFMVPFLFLFPSLPCIPWFIPSSCLDPLRLHSCKLILFVVPFLNSSFRAFRVFRGSSLPRILISLLLIRPIRGPPLPPLPNPFRGSRGSLPALSGPRFPCRRTRP